jgi:AcrR family transcriptional regulator
MTTSSHVRPLGRRERRRNETRARIYQAALELFTSKGYATTNIEEITEAADVAKGTFFNHFPSKEALVEEMTARAMSQVAAAAQRVQQESSVVPVLAMLSGHLADGPGRSGVLLRSLLGTVLSSDSLVAKFTEMAALARQQIATIMARGQQLGELRGDVTADDLARTLQQVVWGTMLLWCANPCDDDLRERLAKAFAMFCQGAVACTRGSAKRKPKQKATPGE